MSAWSGGKEASHCRACSRPPAGGARRNDHRLCRRGSSGGELRVGGITPPRGRRAPEPYGNFWRSDSGSEETFAIAAALARAFPETGLWPLLWASDEEEPWDYWGGAGDVDTVDALDAADVLAELYDEALSRRDRRALATVSPHVWNLGWD